MNWLSFFARLAADAPHLLADAVLLVNDAAHGKGGVGKVETVAADAAKLVTEGAASVASQS